MGVNEFVHNNRKNNDNFYQNIRGFLLQRNIRIKNRKYEYECYISIYDYQFSINPKYFQ